MAFVYVGGVGGAPANNFVRSLQLLGSQYKIIGGSSSPTDLFLSKVDKAFLVPKAKDPGYQDKILSILSREKPDFVHVQHDFEVHAMSALRNEIHALGIKTFMPAHETVEICIDKFKSYQAWEKAGMTVPKTVLLSSPDDLKKAFKDIAPTLWLRATTGAAGAGSLPTSDFDFAEKWITRAKGWGSFTAADLLTPDSVTWSSIWHHGELIVCQGRKRLGWHSGDRAISGVTGMTAVGETVSDPLVDEISAKTVLAIDKKPHGIFSVDLTYDRNHFPNPTEINIGRFFTTHFFFTAAGLNLPHIFCELGIYGKKPELKQKMNPLPEGLVWIRGMDVEPVLIKREKLESLVKDGFMMENRT